MRSCPSSVRLDSLAGFSDQVLEERSVHVAVAEEVPGVLSFLFDPVSPEAGSVGAAETA